MTEEKDDLVNSGYEWPSIPDGIYEAKCIKYNHAFIMGGRSRKLFLLFEITEPGEQNGLKLFKAFNMPKDGKIRRGCDYYKAFCMANGWRKPARLDRMSPKIFLHKIWKIKTRHARPQYGNQEMPESFRYSVVDFIIERVAG